MSRLHLAIAAAVLSVAIAACSTACSDVEHGGARRNVATGSDTTALQPDAAPHPDGLSHDARTEPFHVIAPGSVSLDLRSTSAVCATCHTTDPTSAAMRDSAGRDISPVALWQGTMKANSARDPFFRATLSAERARFPQHVTAIDAKCLGCHAPLATLDARLAGTTPAITDLAVADTRGLLGADGVTCTACHGIAADLAGDPSTWSGNQVYNNENLVFGPHATPFEGPMRNHTGVIPAQGSHVLESAQCSSCHTLVTHALDLPDAPDFNEQTPYLEWLNSEFADREDQMTCQDCHMPTTDIDGVAINTRIARRPPGGDFPRVSPRSPYGRHMFVGGNTLIPEVFKRFRDTLLPGAPDAAFDATIAATRAQLENATAGLVVADASMSNGRLGANIRVVNRTGHKFPSGYPSRRAWLHVVVRDDAGGVMFESGGWDKRGRIVGPGGTPLPTELPGGGFLAHITTISAPTDVMVWEAIMGDRDTLPTIGLLRAASYLKDNRFLPVGWKADGPHADRTRPVGVDGDTDFIGGSDAVRLDVPDLGAAKVLEVRVVYQVLGARWAAELFSAETPDVRAFETMIEAVGLEPVVVGHATISL